MALRWDKYELDGELAKAIRKDIRTFRRERGKWGTWRHKHYEGGHRFRYDDLRVLWGAGDDEYLTYAVLTHCADPVWLLLVCDDELGWDLVSWHHTKREAQVAAELPLPKEPPKPKPKPGLYVFAGWPGKPSSMKVRCSSAYTANVVSEVFAKLGCEVEAKELAA